MTLNAEQCEVQPSPRTNPTHEHRLGTTWVNSSFDEKGLEVLVGSKFNINQQWTPTTSKRNHNTGYISLGSTVPLCLAPGRPNSEYCCVWTSPFRRDAWKLSKVHDTAIKMGQ